MSGEFLMKTHKLTRIMIIVSIISLIFMPLLPWISSTPGETSGTYINEGFLDIASNAYYSGSSDSAEAAKLNNDLGLISLSFWLVLVFSIVSLIGIAIYKIEKTPFISHIILLIGCMTIIFGILVIFGHWNFIVHVGDISGYSSVFYGYNYIPLIMGIILLFTSISYTTTVAPTSTRSLVYYFRQRQSEAEAKYQEYRTRVERQPADASYHLTEKPSPTSVQKKTGTTPKSCPECGVKLGGNPKFCQKCGRKLI